jgi:hypothetical protein
MAIPSLIIRLKRIQAVPENGMNREREKSESKLSWIGPLHRNGRDDDDDDETRSYRRKNRADADQSSSVRIKNVSLFSLSVCVHFYCQRVLYLRGGPTPPPPTPEALHATFLLSELFEFNDWVWI